jgi:hypothetical protein
MEPMRAHAHAAAPQQRKRLIAPATRPRRTRAGSGGSPDPVLTSGQFRYGARSDSRPGDLLSAAVHRFKAAATSSTERLGAGFCRTPGVSPEAR